MKKDGRGRRGEMRELEMGGERKSWAFFPLRSLVFCKSSSRKIRLKGPSGCCGTIHSVSPPPTPSHTPSNPSRYCLSLCLMAELRFLAMPLVIQLISGGVGLLTSLVQDSSTLSHPLCARAHTPTHTHTLVLQRAKSGRRELSDVCARTNVIFLFYFFCLMFKTARRLMTCRKAI